MELSRDLEERLMTAEESADRYNAAVAVIKPPDDWTGTEREFQEAYMAGWQDCLVTAVESAAAEGFQKGILLGRIVGNRVGMREVSARYDAEQETLQPRLSGRPRREIGEASILF